MADSGSGTDDSLRVAAAVRDCLAPLRVSEVFEPVVEHVLRGTGLEALATLRGRPAGADMVPASGAPRGSSCWPTT